MKILHLCLLLLSFTSISTYASSKYAKSRTKKKVIVPPGTVEISENYFFDATEITNLNWLEYMYWNKNKFGENSDEFKACLPDTTVWLPYGEPYAKFYLRHVSYQNYPVVGISHEQAIAFCEWRTDRVNEFHFAQSNKEAYANYQKVPTKGTIPRIFEYRLPTETEWEKIAQLPFSKRTLRKMKTDSPYNLDEEPLNAEMDKDGTEVTAPVDAYWANIKGIYNMIGNVAEMVAEKGISKGGSYTQTLADAQPDQRINYAEPSRWIGFRCACNRIN